MIMIDSCGTVHRHDNKIQGVNVFCSNYIVFLLKGVITHLPFGCTPIKFIMFGSSSNVTLCSKTQQKLVRAPFTVFSKVIYIHLHVNIYIRCFKQPHCFAFVQQTDNCEVCVYRHQWFTDNTGGSRMFSDKHRCRNRTRSLGFSMHQHHVSLGSRQKYLETKSWIWRGHYSNKVSTTPYVLCSTYIEVLC